MAILLLLIFLFQPLFSDYRGEYTLSDFHGSPSAIVGGHVNVITGDFIDYEVDCVLEGPQSFALDRVYSSSQLKSGTLNGGWSINYNHSAKYFPETTWGDRGEKKIKNFFLVADGMGTMMRYRSLHNHKQVAGGYRCEKKQWDRGLTNNSPEGISGKTNVMNDEAWIDRKKANLRTGSGDVLYFEAMPIKPKIIDGIDFTNEDHIIYLPTHKTKLNCTTEQYRFNEENITLSEVRFMGSQGKELGFFKFDNSGDEIGVDTPSGSSVYWGFSPIKHLDRDSYFLDTVDRPTLPSVSYSYERYTSYFQNKRAVRMTAKRYPDQRFTRVSYYGEGKYKVQNEGFKIKDVEDIRYGRVKKLLRPLGETADEITEYRFVYHVHHNHGHLEGRTDVFDALGYKKTYHFDKSRLQTIDEFLDEKLYRVERYLWGNTKNGFKEGHYIGKYIEDYMAYAHSGNLLRYDDFGNVIRESLVGNLTGKSKDFFKSEAYSPPKGIDHYTTERSYSQDMKNLLLRESDFRKEVTYSYVEGTNLVSAMLLSDFKQVRKREFFFYDENGVKLKHIVDDGTASDVNDLQNITERLITEFIPRTIYPIGIPEEVVFKAYDPKDKTEKLLKRVKNSYTKEGWLICEEVYDANDTFQYAKKYRHNKFGKVIYEEDAMGYVVEKNYDANHNLIEVKGPNPGFQKRFTYDYCNRLIKEEEIFESQHLVKSYTYNLKGECIEETDFGGNVTRYRYDELGRKISTLTPVFLSEEGHLPMETHTVYDVLNNPHFITDVRGNRTQIFCTPRGKPYRTLHPDGTTETTYYDLDGQINETIDKYGNKTVITNDYQGRPVATEVCSSNGDLLKRSTREYNAFHLVKETDPLGLETFYEYDFAGNLICKRRGSSQEDYTYDSMARLFQTTTWTSGTDAIITSKRYDHLNRVIEEKIESLSGILQSCTRYEYDALGKKTKEIHQISEDEEAITRYVYNARGDIIETISPEGASTKISHNYEYLDEQVERCTRITSIDPKGIITTVDKNPLGLEKRICKKNSFGETVQLSEILFNEFGEKSKRIETVFESGKPLRKVTTAWKYDHLGRLESLTEAFGSPDSKTTSITYNAFGQQDSIIKPSGLKILYSYDHLGRMSHWTASDNSFSYTYTYDIMDRPVNVQSRENTNTLKTYDIEGRLIEETLSNGLTVKTSYDRAGRPTSLTYSDGSHVTYEYEGARTKRIKRKDYTFEALEYNLRGKLTKAKLPNSQILEMTYDIMGRTTKNHAPSFQETITKYDLAGNLLHRTLMDSEEEFYSYDDLNQLTSENGHTYRFDALYNRTHEDGTTNTINDLNQTLERKDRSYLYDVDGNLIVIYKPDRHLHFRYDALGRMTYFMDGTIESFYTYDETNRRTQKIVNGTLTRFIYNGQCELGTQNGEMRILSGLGLGAEIGEAIAIERQDQILTPYHDHNGNLMTLANMEGQTVYNARYGAFGLETTKEGEEIPWGFASKRKDPEIGLIFFGRRYYDPESGRFITKDPLGDRDGPNLYAYVKNNPLMLIDLWGLIAEEKSKGFSPFSYLKSGVSAIGSGIEGIGKHALPASPVRTGVMGVGRVIQGQSFYNLNEHYYPMDFRKVGENTVPWRVNISHAGIMTEREGGHQFASLVSKALGGEQVWGLTHRTYGFTNDLAICGHLVLGKQTRGSRKLAEMVIHAYNDMWQSGVLNPQINIIAHSRGGLETNLALRLLPLEIKKCLGVYTLGSAYPIKDDSLRECRNFQNPDDLIPKIARMYSGGNGANITNTGYSSGSVFGGIQDHLIETPGYLKSIRDIGYKISGDEGIR